jgi:hypothetical protein
VNGPYDCNLVSQLPQLERGSDDTASEDTQGEESTQEGKAVEGGGLPTIPESSTGMNSSRKRPRSAPTHQRRLSPYTILFDIGHLPEGEGPRGVYGEAGEGRGEREGGIWYVEERPKRPPPPKIRVLPRLGVETLERRKMFLDEVRPRDLRRIRIPYMSYHRA